MFFLKQAKQGETRLIMENVIHVEHPSVDRDTAMDNDPSEQMNTAMNRGPSFRRFIINKEFENQQRNIEEEAQIDEEFNFCSLLKESDQGISFDNDPANISSPEWLRIPLSNKNTTVNIVMDDDYDCLKHSNVFMNTEKEKEEDTDPEDEELFERVQVQIDIAKRQKQYLEDLQINQESENEPGNHALKEGANHYTIPDDKIIEEDEFSFHGFVKEDEKESASPKDLQMIQEPDNQAFLKEVADHIKIPDKKIIEEDEFSSLQKEIMQGRISFDGTSNSRFVKEDRKESVPLKDLQMNQAFMKEVADPDKKIVEEDEFSLLQKAIMQGRFRIDRISNSKFLKRDRSLATVAGLTSLLRSSSSCSTFTVEDCCLVKHQISKAEMLFSKISRALRFTNRILKSGDHANAGISRASSIKSEVALKTLFQDQ